MKKFKIDYSWYKAERGSGKVIIEALTQEEAQGLADDGLNETARCYVEELEEQE